MSSIHTSALRTIAAAERHWAARRISEDDSAAAMIWLRAARAAWAAGDADEAALWYRRAADGLLLCAEHTGRIMGTYAYYAELAVGAAMRAGGEAILDRIASTVHHHLPIKTAVRRGRHAASRPGDPVLASQAVVCAWAAWVCNAQQDAADLLRMVVRETHAFPSVTKQRWQEKRWSSLHDAVDALLQLDDARLRLALRALDARSTGARARAPTPSDLVDETIVVLAAEWRARARTQIDMQGLHTLLSPGIPEPSPAAADPADVIAG